MTRKARLWTGATLLTAILLNYALIGFPLARRGSSIQSKYKATLIKQAKSGEIFKNSEDEYMLEIFRKEKSSIDKRILILNCAAITLLIFATSWTIFGIIFHKGK